MSEPEARRAGWTEERAQRRRSEHVTREARANKRAAGERRAQCEPEARRAGWTEERAQRRRSEHVTREARANKRAAGERRAHS
ncbi:hypothetical protein FHX41_3092 [Actinomadura hallensis]|uniref:Uncharacterized protein n=1 Tax=Actinomadura hallensis TaxID=337895 RepID=A0A543IFN5_9ACTN|nr:hypothetical protein FHX41_3092 [Actinomadura hallensis]